MATFFLMKLVEKAFLIYNILQRVMVESKNLRLAVRFFLVNQEIIIKTKNHKTIY